MRAFILVVLAFVMATAQADPARAKAWMESVRKDSKGTFVSTNDWAGAEADSILASIDARSVAELADEELGFIHKAITATLVTNETKRASRAASMERLLGHPKPGVVSGAKVAILGWFADASRAEALRNELAGETKAASGAWAAGKRLGMDQMAFAAPLFGSIRGKGCLHPAYRKWFLEETRKQIPSLARKAVRAEIDGLMDDVSVPLTDEKRAWIDELRLRLMVAKEKEASP